MQTILRKNALEILQAGLSALKPENVLNEKIWRKLPLPPHQKIYVVGAGKGVRFLAAQLEEILGEKIEAGFVNDKEELILKKIKVNQAGHPLPDKGSLAGTQKIIQLIRGTSEKDLIICLLTGGASALLTWPTFALKRVAEFFDKLLKSGADIQEMNIIRKHLDRVKGGGLALIIYPRPCLSLIVSDVPGNDLKTIASGPTVFDDSTKEEAEKILEKWGLPKLPLLETPKDKKIFKNVKNFLLATNKIGLLAMKKKAEERKFRTKILSDKLKGETESVGQMLIEKSKIKGLALIAGGETTIRVTSNGKGGRNTHLCLSVLKNLPKNTVLLSVDSDGEDNTEAAGAIISQDTIKKAQKLGLKPEDYLKNFDSYNFFKKTGDLIKTGPQPTNVGDLILALKGS